MTPPAITAPIPPAPGPPITDPGPGGITLSWAELDGEIRQAERTGLCARPVRLTGRIDAVDLATGELRTMYDTDAEPTWPAWPD